MIDPICTDDTVAALRPLHAWHVGAERDAIETDTRLWSMPGIFRRWGSLYAPLYLLRTGDWRSTIALALIFPAMLWAHRSNFARWREGKEQTFRQFLFSRHEPQREEAGE